MLTYNTEEGEGGNKGEGALFKHASLKKLLRFLSSLYTTPRHVRLAQEVRWVLIAYRRVSAKNKSLIFFVH